MTFLLLASVAAVAVMALAQGKNRTLSEWYEIDQANIASLEAGTGRWYAYEAATQDILITHRWMVGNRTLALMSVTELTPGQIFDASYAVTYRALSLEGLTPQNLLTTPVKEVGNIVVSVLQAGYGYEVEAIAWPPGMVTADF